MVRNHVVTRPVAAILRRFGRLGGGQRPAPGRLEAGFRWGSRSRRRILREKWEALAGAWILREKRIGEMRGINCPKDIRGACRKHRDNSDYPDFKQWVPDLFFQKNC